MRRHCMFDSLIIRYTELRVWHRTDLECPEGYGRLHPAIAWEEWVAWKWYLGGFLDQLMDWYSGNPWSGDSSMRSGLPI